MRKHCDEIGRKVNIVCAPSRGSANHRWMVTEVGRSKIPLVTWSAHSSHALWRKKAESDLRQAGLLPPAKQQKKETATVPRLTNDELALADELRERMESFLRTHSREELYEKGFALIQEGTDGVSPYLGTESTSAEELCQTALKRFLDDGKGWKQINIDRWNMVIDTLLGGPHGNGHVDPLLAAETPTPPAESPEPDPEPEPKAEVDKDTAEMLLLAEQMLKAAEEEREEAEKERDAATAERDRLAEELRAVTAQVENQEKALSVLTESKDMTINDLERQLGASIGRNEELRKIQDEMDERIAALVRDAERLTVEVERYGVRGMDPAQDSVFRERYFDALLQILIRENDSDSNVLPRLDALTGLMLGG